MFLPSETYTISSVASSKALLKAVVPLLRLVSATDPADPVVRSQARKLIDSVPV